MGASRDKDDVSTTPLKPGSSDEDAVTRSRDDDATEVDDVPLAPDTLLAGRYRILRFVARGGMGEVYEAMDEELRTRLAVKTMRAALGRDRTALDRMRREVQLARAVTHANVCRIFDLGHTTIDDRKITFITMEFLEGESLHARLKVRKSLPPDEALPLALDVLAGLDACHRAGIIHRDLKAENILLVKRADREHAVLTDFGIARAEQPGRDSSLTGEGSLVGSPAFMSPEQVNGEPASVTTDIHAVGVLLWELVVGSWPMRKLAPLDVVRALAKPNPFGPVPGSVPTEWADAIRGCLAPANKRFASIYAVLDVLAPDRVDSRRSDPNLRRSDPSLRRSGEPELPSGAAATVRSGLLARPPRRWFLPLAGAVVVVSTITGYLVWPHGGSKSKQPATLAEPVAVERTLEDDLLSLDLAHAHDGLAAMGNELDVLIKRARVEMKQGDWPAATATIAQARAVHDPGRTAQLAMTAIEKRLAGDLEGATAALENLHDGAPEDVVIAFELADADIALGRLPEAAKVLDEIAARPLNERAKARLALARAERLFATMSVDQPELEKVVTQAIDAAHETRAPVLEERGLAIRSITRMFLGHPDDGKRDLERAGKLADDNHDVRGLSVVHRARGIYFYNIDIDFEKAIAEGDKAIELAKQVHDDVLLALAENMRAGSLKEVARIDEAIVAYKASETAALRALREDIANTRARPNLASMYEDLGQVDKSKDMTLKVQASRGSPDPNGVEEVLLFGLYLDRGELPEADQHAAKANAVATAMKNQSSQALLDGAVAREVYEKGDDDAYRRALARAEASAIAAAGGENDPYLWLVKGRSLLDTPAAAVPKYDKVLADPAISGGVRGMLLVMSARALLATGQRDKAIARRAELTSNKLYAPYLRATFEDRVLAAELAQTPADRAAAARGITEFRETLRSNGLIVLSWNADLELARLAEADHNRKEAVRLANSVVQTASAAGFMRLARRGKAFLATLRAR